MKERICVDVHMGCFGITSGCGHGVEGGFGVFGYRRFVVYRELLD